MIVFATAMALIALVLANGRKPQDKEKIKDFFRRKLTSKASQAL